jgi:hypothetical protein
MRARNAALARAKVFRAEPFVPSTIDFSKDPNGGVIDRHLMTCKFLATDVSGTTPKFDCELPGGEAIKVKYSWTREIPAEVAATRLLDALGFGADRLSRVDTVRCFGCVAAPFHERAVMQKLGLLKRFDQHLSYSTANEFHDVAVERKLDGKSIAAGDLKGWGFWELEMIDESQGGATRAEVDALRLMAMFLNHWDNKLQNQRLICVDSDSNDCVHPLAMMQDVGSTFGPSKANLAKWWRTPVWSEAATCTLSMSKLPWGGSTFKDVRISEAGRKLLGDRLTQLSRRQIEDLFTVAGFHDVPQWTQAFGDRVRQIAGARCPPTVLGAQ